MTQFGDYVYSQMVADRMRDLAADTDQIRLAKTLRQGETSWGERVRRRFGHLTTAPAPTAPPGPTPAAA